VSSKDVIEDDEPVKVRLPNTVFGAIEFLNFTPSCILGAREVLSTVRESGYTNPSRLLSGESRGRLDIGPPFTNFFSKVITPSQLLH